MTLFDDYVERGCTPGGGGGYSHSLDGGVPLGSRKSNPLLDRILQILWRYTRPKMLSCSWFQSFVSDPVKRDPRPYTRQIFYDY